MIRVAICDDEVSSLELLYAQVANYLKAQEGVEFLVRRFQSVYDLLECLERPELYFDLYLLDVIMPMYSGIEVGKMIRKRDDYATIIYTTSSDRFALEASSTAPLQYMIKPIEPEAIAKVLDKALNRIDRPASKNLLIKRKEGYFNVGIHRIEYVEYLNHALAFHLGDGSTVMSRVIQESFSAVVESALTDPRFIKPHASFVVNMDHVAGINQREFEMISGAIVPISKRVYSDVKQRFIDYVSAFHDGVVI